MEHREALMKEQVSQREKDLERDLYEQRQRAMEELNNANQLKMEVQREQQSGKACKKSCIIYPCTYQLFRFASRISFFRCSSTLNLIKASDITVTVG